MIEDAQRMIINFSSISVRLGLSYPEQLEIIVTVNRKGKSIDVSFYNSQMC